MTIDSAKKEFFCTTFQTGCRRDNLDTSGTLVDNPQKPSNSSLLLSGSVGKKKKNSQLLY